LIVFCQKLIVGSALFFFKVLADEYPLVKWRYNWKPEPATPEAGLYESFLKSREWL
jgi:coproporphyrinogen III oxidase